MPQTQIILDSSSAQELAVVLQKAAEFLQQRSIGRTIPAFYGTNYRIRIQGRDVVIEMDHPDDATADHDHPHYKHFISVRYVTQSGEQLYHSFKEKQNASTQEDGPLARSTGPNLS